METPTAEQFERAKPPVLSNWTFEQEYETSFKVTNTETGEHVQAMIDPDQEQLRLVPMVSQGSGYSSVQSAGTSHRLGDHDEIVEQAWEIAKKIRNGEIGRDEADFVL